VQNSDLFKLSTAPLQFEIRIFQRRRLESIYRCAGQLHAAKGIVVAEQFARRGSWRGIRAAAENQGAVNVEQEKNHVWDLCIGQRTGLTMRSRARVELI
jgi:hypothetical protein